ncbi:class I SAM-dependent methyltransferase [Tuwongella immobilis]|uniref:Methyltransferase domain-containing protein n=1 Tax=Tuwongella immobilis TaxID=692036 RepID=A0A6C2YSQ1_9BACT|nr:class I SAM-dependent methyltransferase [Tuwongella immobilis]VIP04476.1 methyltransferase type 11 domain protein : Methyltransferase type 11 OS=Isosphaera pallida (strain ATCC 43644 / DSM 9630 / IS1B) GN=Isop_0474 PE=4 SV=1: Methyltransf_23 [Tuwongella immobilis]VTS06314.1 methyltransferase type 11 domain protein : Methyltransferase type 11 OS=Isosphaera pallida (strain ATCC 43644 / DSM 9630 / IS1B) GN=Isop_0474 PE=4 SV=1: Methyltransf_23 [Tuwongella immobilis]
MSIPDWKLPAGVDRGLWDYMQSEAQAEQYDTVMAGTPLLEHDLQFCQRWLTPPGRILDLGCGTGRLLTFLAPLGYSGVGVDLSEPMLLELSVKVQKQGYSIDRLKASLVDLGAIKDATFDHAACLFSTLGMIRGVEPRRQALAEMVRILKPGGRLALHVHNRDHHLLVPYGRGWWLRDLWRRLIRSPKVGDRTMPMPRAGADVTLHHFGYGEILRETRRVGLRLLASETIAPNQIGPLAMPWLLPIVRSYGYLLALEKPADADPRSAAAHRVD